jgi:triacylglycerol lipase
LNATVSGTTATLTAALDDARQRIRAIGPRVSVEIMAEMKTAFAPLLAGVTPGLRIERELAYGDDPRHRLNLFLPQHRDPDGAAVLVFVHGGGFAAGDKDESPGAFYDNVGLWAARHGIIGATVNYRLAPRHAWPAGRDDVAAAVGWIAANIASFGGNPGRIVLVGHSAGAAHVAGVVGQRNHAARLAGCICISGIYDLSITPVNPVYFGADPALYVERSPLGGLAAAATPLLVVLAEFDPEFIQQHGVSLLRAVLAEKKRLPRLVQIPAHNHFSVLLHLDSPDKALADAIMAFVTRVSAAAET